MTLDFPYFYFMLGENLGRSLLYEDVSVMRVTTTVRSTTPQILTRTKIMSSKPNLKITKSTNRQDNKRTYRKLREQLFFSKGGHSATPPPPPTESSIICTHIRKTELKLTSKRARATEQTTAEPGAVAQSVASPLRMQADPRSTLLLWRLFPSSAVPRGAKCQLMAKEWALNTGKLPLGGFPRNGVVKCG